MSTFGTFREAVVEAIRECRHWMGGAVVVGEMNPSTGEDEYRAIPGAYLNDISYTGARTVFWRVTDPIEVGGPDATVADAETLADLVVEDEDA
jgi:hypothetical protein